MKKRNRILAVFLVLGMATGCSRVNSSSGNEQAVVTAQETAQLEKAIDEMPVAEGRHNRSDDYMAVFATHMLSADSFSVHMEDRVYEESALRESAKAIGRDLAEAANAAGTKGKEVTIYIVGETLSGSPMVLGTQVFCTPQDLSSGAYREQLLGAAYGLAGWQQAGFAAYVFEEADEESLKAYYAEGGHDLTLSCSPVYMCPLLADEETVRAARQTARSLTAFIIEKEGFSSFCATLDHSRILSDWKQSMGLEDLGDLPEGSSKAVSMKLSYPKHYVCALDVDNITFAIEENSFMKEADDLYTLICSYLAGMDMVLEQIEKEAPSVIDIARQKYAEPFRIVMQDPTGHTYAEIYRNEICLTKADPVWHETVHLLLEQPTDESFAWQCEAVADYFSFAAATRFEPDHTICKGYREYLDFFVLASSREAEADDLVFHNSVWNLYQTFCPKEVTGYDDLEAYYHAYGISAIMLEGEIKRSQIRTKYDSSVASKRGDRNGRKQNDGNALGYPEAEAVFEYLAETYGIDEAVNAYINGVSLQKAFGITYAELYAEARESYRKQYLDLALKEIPES